MPSYRGVDIEAVKDSLRRAVARLRKWDIGDATKDMLDVWKSGTPFNSIDQAATDRDVAIMMNVTGTKNLLVRLSDVFRYHAAVSARGEKGAPAQDQKIYKDLVAWGAFVDDMREDNWQAVQDEATQFMLKQCLGRLTEEDCVPGRPAYGVFQEALQQLHQQDPDADIPDTEAWFRQSLPLYIGMHRAGEDEEMNRFLDEKPNIIPFLVQTIYRMTGLPAEEGKIDLDPPLRSYHAVIPYPGAGPDAGTARVEFNRVKREQEYDRFREKAVDMVSTELEPFFSTDESTARITARDIEGAGACAVTFLATKEAVQALADNMPYPLFDADERQIMPVRRDFPPPSREPAT